MAVVMRRVTPGFLTEMFRADNRFITLQLTASVTRAGTFWLYAAFGADAVAFFAIKLPETKAAVSKR